MGRSNRIVSGASKRAAGAGPWAWAWGARACAGLAFAGWLVGCGSSSPGSAPNTTPATTAAPLVFVGEVQGTDVLVGIVATTHHARVFFCGGDTSYATLTHWIPSASLDPAGGALTQASDTAGWSVSGTLDEGGATGTVVAGATGSFTFHAAPVAAGTIAGLYESTLPCGKVGLIVAQDSGADAPTGQGACVPSVPGGTASTEQVNPIRPIARAADGTIPVSVGTTTTAVHAAAPPAE
jgi:hypothetical protein